MPFAWGLRVGKMNSERGRIARVYHMKLKKFPRKEKENLVYSGRIAKTKILNVLLLTVYNV